MESMRIGDKGPEVLLLQSKLKDLGIYQGALDGDFGPKTHEAVDWFQQKNGLFVDGIAGKVTLAKLELVTPLSTTIPTLKVVVDTQASGGCYPNFRVRADCAGSLAEVKRVVEFAGGRLRSSGGIRDLSDPPNANRAMASFHYLGLAIDLCTLAGMRDPDRDPYIITPDTREGHAGRWIVYCATDAPTVAIETLKATFIAGGKVQSKTVTRRCFSLTEAFENEGWVGVPARSGFGLRADIMAAEWWHFQWVKTLVGGMTYGGELLKLYGQSEIDTPEERKWFAQVRNLTWNGRSFT